MKRGLRIVFIIFLVADLSQSRSNLLEKLESIYEELHDEIYDYDNRNFGKIFIKFRIYKN